MHFITERTRTERKSKLDWFTHCEKDAVVCHALNPGTSSHNLTVDVYRMEAFWSHFVESAAERVDQKERPAISQRPHPLTTVSVTLW